MFYISRFKDIEKKEYEFEVVTPLFLGGADPQKAELRAPPIKAALRFWWRATANLDDLGDMAKREGDIFGSTEEASALRVIVEDQGLVPTQRDLPRGKMYPVTSKGRTFPISIIEYLAFGLFDPGRRTERYLRNYFDVGKRFKISVSFPQRMEEEILRALSLMASFGGLGSRSRNGFGSLHCPDLADSSLPRRGALRPFTAFSDKAQLFNAFPPQAQWQDALSAIGLAYREARLKLERRHEWDRRALIAMPIESKSERNIPLHIRQGRHAKPYFLHVNKTTDGQYQGQILFLPYLYRSGPTDTSHRLDAYLKACHDMNEEIRRHMGGVA